MCKDKTHWQPCARATHLGSHLPEQDFFRTIDQDKTPWQPYARTIFLVRYEPGQDLLIVRCRDKASWQPCARTRHLNSHLNLHDSLTSSVQDCLTRTPLDPGSPLGLPCVFPFNLGSSSHTGCTVEGHPHGLAWCSTQVYTQHAGLRCFWEKSRRPSGSFSAVGHLTPWYCAFWVSVFLKVMIWFRCGSCEFSVCLILLHNWNSSCWHW